MKYISWNVNGLRACVGKGFMDYFNETGADAFCLQETKLSPDQIKLDMPGYTAIWNSADKKGYSGTAIFTKKEPFNVTMGLGIDEHDHEGRVICAEFDTHYLVCVYTPNSQRDLKRLDYRMKWEDDFRAYLKALDEKKPVIVCGDMKDAHPSYKSTSKKPIIVCGDLNVAATALDLRNPDANRGNAGFTDEERGKFAALLEAGYTDTFRHLHPDEAKYSWWSYRAGARARNIGWRLDYFLVSDFARECIRSAEIHTDILGSDHAPISLEIDV